MKKIIAALLLLCASVAGATTLVPVPLLNPAGSTAGQVALSNGPVTAPGWGNVGATSLAAQAANTVVANVTGSSASPTAFPMPTCNTSTSALQYTPGTGWICYTNSASLTGATFTGAITAPGVTTSANFLGSGNGYSIGNTTGLSSGGAIQLFDSTHGNNVSILVGGSQVANFTSTGITNAPISGSTGSFTTLAASSTVSGAGFSTYLASPPAIGGTAPAAGTFTTLKGNSLAKVFATNTSGQSIPNNTSTTVTGWTTVRDANSNFVASTGIFTAPATADYLVCGQLIMSGSGISNGIVEMTFLANAAAWAIANSPVAATTVTDNTVSGCADVFVSSGQTISLNLLQNSGGAQSLATAAKQLYLSIVQLP